MNTQKTYTKMGVRIVENAQGKNDFDSIHLFCIYIYLKKKAEIFAEINLHCE